MKSTTLRVGVFWAVCMAGAACTSEIGSNSWGGPAEITMIDSGAAEDGVSAENEDSGIDKPCGPVHYVDMSFLGLVLDHSGAVAPDVRVWIEEREWSLGTTVFSEPDMRSRSNGTFVLHLTDMPVVERCWGFAVGYFLMADAGGCSCEVPINYNLWRAWEDGSMTATALGAPCALVVADQH